MLEAGDKVPADARIIEERNLEVNEAPLTGESIPVSKQNEKLSGEISLSEQKNMLFAGTQITRGTVKAMVTTTGTDTVFGTVTKDLQDLNEENTPIEKRLDKFSKQIGLIVLGIVLLLMVFGFTNHLNKIDMFLTSVALAVSAIPEGLPAVLALGFAISSTLMSKKNVVIRKLPAVEALGSVTTICTDKTGTLTEEKMIVQEIFSDNKLYKRENDDLKLKNKKIFLNDNKNLLELIETSILTNNARFEEINGKISYFGDPTEISLIEFANLFGINKKELTEERPTIEKIEFDSKRKMMSTLRNVGGKMILYSKGSPESILENSMYELIGGKIKKLTDKRKKELFKESNKLEKKALRVLAFAKKEINSKNKLNEKDLIFLGFSGMIDPPRKEIAKAIQDCKDAGISIKIITGDSPLTAKAIGEKLGIIGNIVTDLELKKMSDTELIETISKISIFARVTSEQKLRITKILQTTGETVAVTGDGVNDALALKSADVGVAMGIRGTDVSRDVADIVLIDDNFASIVEGVKEGRRTYDNIKKFTKYLLAVNFSSIALVLYSIICKIPLPLLPLQILWMNLASDSFPSLSLIFEKEEDVMKTKPRKEKSILSGEYKYIIFSGILAFVVELSIFLIAYNKFPIDSARTILLTTAILYELVFVYTVRSNKPLVKIGIFSNKWLNYSVIFSLILHIVLMYTKIGSVFGLIPLTLNNWLLILPFAFSGLVIFEIAKYFKKNKN